MIPESKHRPLGNSGIMVSPLGAGTNRWSKGENDEAIFQTYKTLLDAGVNFFDTAEIYNNGKSEQLLGSCHKSDPRHVVIASKFMPYPTRITATQFMNALDASLRRLDVSKIDLYYIHFPFPPLSIETLMEWMAKAYESGKIHAVGVSNFDAKQMRLAVTALSKYNIPLAANEVHYNLLHRQPEVDGVLDACQELNVALVAYRPLERGRLKEITTSGAPPNTSISNNSKETKTSKEKALKDILQNIAEQHGKSVTQVALNWLLRRDGHVIPIPGATKANHALENVEALNWEMNKDEFAAIDQASSPSRQ